MGKIKVEKELYEALNELSKLKLKFNSLSETESILRIHARHLENGENLYSKKLKPLYNLTITELYNLLNFGYELERTPEEKLCSLYKRYDEEGKIFESGVAKGIELAIKTLDKKIEGINA